MLAPKGWTIGPAEGFTAAGAGVTTTVPMDRTQVLKVQLTR